MLEIEVMIYMIQVFELGSRLFFLYVMVVLDAQASQAKYSITLPSGDLNCYSLDPDTNFSYAIKQNHSHYLATVELHNIFLPLDDSVMKYLS